MFCPKCGTQNPETGKFCRSCGTDLGNVSSALTGQLPRNVPLVDRKGKPVSYERAIVKLFTGFAFIAVAIALAFTGNGRGWWFWLLIPAFTSLGAGVAQYVQLKKVEKGLPIYAPGVTPPQSAEHLYRPCRRRRRHMSRRIRVSKPAISCRRASPTTPRVISKWNPRTRRRRFQEMTFNA